MHSVTHDEYSPRNLQYDKCDVHGGSHLLNHQSLRLMWLGFLQSTAFRPDVFQGVVTTVAGDGQEGSDDGDAMEASFSFPGGIALYNDSSEG